MNDPHETKQDPFGHKTNPAHKERINEIANFLGDDAPFLRVLDVGCSEGFPTSRFALMTDHITGIDVSEVAVDRANDEHGDGDVEFECADFLEYKPKRKFDLVIVTAMPHLFDDMDKFAEAVSRCMKKRGGRLLVSHVKSASDGNGYLSRLEAAGFRAVRSGSFDCGGSEHSIHLLKF